MSKIKVKLLTKRTAVAVALFSVCILSLGFFGYQIVNSIVIFSSITNQKVTTTGTKICNACVAPIPKDSAFYQNWPLGPIDCSLRAFYMTNGLNNSSNGIVTMSKQTSFIQSLANQIPIGATPHDTVQNIMNWMHSNSGGGIKNCNESSDRRFDKTSEEIIKSKCASGCNQWTLAFVALSRAKGIPATMVETVSDRWITESINAGCIKQPKFGHVIADVYTGVNVNGGWELADPTAGYFTVYENNDFSGYALMRFNAYNQSEATQEFGSGYRYRVLRRGIDSWDYGVTSDEVWTQAVIGEYSMPRNICD